MSDVQCYVLSVVLSNVQCYVLSMVLICMYACNMYVCMYVLYCSIAFLPQLFIILLFHAHTHNHLCHSMYTQAWHIVYHDSFCHFMLRSRAVLALTSDVYLYISIIIAI